MQNNRHMRTILVVLTMALVLGLSILAYIAQADPATVILAAIAAVIILGTVATMAAPVAEGSSSAISVMENDIADGHANTLAQLAALPHFRQLRDGSVVEFFHGQRIAPCRWGEEPPHLALFHGKNALITFMTAEAMDHYLSIQEAVGRLLTSRRNAP